jgi:hypothetical protein
LDAGSLRYEGERCRTRARSTNNNNDQEDADLLEDTVEDSNESSEDKIDHFENLEINVPIFA